MRVIITGGAGFIGSNLANNLAQKKSNKILAIDNLFLGNPKNLEEKSNITFLESDVRMLELYNIFQQFKPTHVVHLAALSSAPMFSDGKCNSPKEWTNVNVKGWQNVLEIAKQEGARLVYASTSSLYGGVTEEPPYREDMFIRPRTFYESTLYTRELLANSYYHSLNYPSLGLRFFAVYGPNEKHKGKYANNITQFTWDILNQEPPILYGDGKQTRDFTHVSDVVEAIKLAMKYKKLHGVLNVGTGTETTLTDVVKTINYYAPEPIKPRYIKNPLKNYVSRTLADTSRAETILGFKAKTPIDKGIQMQVEEYSRIEYLRPKNFDR